MSKLISIIRQKIGFQPITNKIAKDRLNMMVHQQRMGIHNEKLLFDVTAVVTQYLKIQANKNPYISYGDDEVILHFPIEQTRI
mmetsp:Transcript_23415/g.24058  ORF Transcript_23415/g.24058 Transcript_23415/m.24058 type:complete len:83 (+) Transcript_23415:71-319(+)